MQRVAANPERPRVRGVLLLLLWAWAATIFMVVDLFLNVAEFDSIRPRSSLYEGMRIAAHEMVGEPILDRRFQGAPSLATLRARARQGSALAHVPPGRRRLEELKRLGREGSFEPLRAALTGEWDPRLRVAAMRVLAESFGADARDVLLERAHDPHETEWVRAEAAYYVGWTGSESYAALEEILLRGGLPDPLRAGALRGMGRCGSAAAVARALCCAGEGSPPLLRAAREVLERADDPEAEPLLREVAVDPVRAEDLRVSACRGLGTIGSMQAVGSLAALLSDRTVAVSVRMAAADGLARTGKPEALRLVAQHCDDPCKAVAAAARRARDGLPVSEAG